MSRPAYPSDTQDQFAVRFPDGMRDAIKIAAKANNRSMNAEIIDRLEQSLKADPDLESLVSRLEAAVKALEMRA